MSYPSEWRCETLHVETEVAAITQQHGLLTVGIMADLHKWTMDKLPYIVFKSYDCAVITDCRNIKKNYK